jgi:transcriptional regulator with XRE-family HTH domain
MEFGEWLRTQLRQRGETMAAFADLVGVTAATVSRWISGQRRPDVASTQKIARVLQLPTELVMEMAGYEVTEDNEQEAIQRELTRLHAEQEALEQQGQQAQQRLTELRHRIDVLRANEDQLQVGKLLTQGTMHMRFQRSVKSEPDLGSADDISGRLSDVGGLRAGTPARHRRWSSLQILEGLLPEPERLGNDFLTDFRDHWSEREQDAFAVGLQFGLCVSEALAAQRQRDK